MIHGHFLNFTHETHLSENDEAKKEQAVINITPLSDPTLLSDYTYKHVWLPLSGQEGRYFAKSPFEEADAGFSWGLEVKEVLTLIWEPKTQCIYYLISKHYSPKRLRFWVYHTFFPMSLEFNQKYHFLHVGAVEVHGKSVFFSAPSFGGKSTLTDFFIRQGSTLISDDAVGVEEKDANYYAIPAYPYHRPYREPEELGYRVGKFAALAKPIDAVFLLKRVKTKDNIVIEEVKGVEKFKAFHESIFIPFPFRKKERFTFFGKMAQQIPVYRITIPWDLKRLKEVYTAIIIHLQTL